MHFILSVISKTLIATYISQVTKAPEEQIAQAMNAAGPVPSALRVTVPPELQGVAFISVLCQKGILQSCSCLQRSHSSLVIEHIS